jgi:hypothetical protein
MPLASSWLLCDRKRMQPPDALVMTATIAPSPEMGQTLRRDSSVRLHDYCEALRWYLSLPNDVVDRIVVLENSRSDLNVFAELLAKVGSDKRVELLSTCPDTPPQRGKGYAESLMIEEGLRRSTLLAFGSAFWKVTGRLRVLNLTALVRSAPPQFDLYCDLRDVPLIGESLGGNQWMDTRLFASTPASYMRLFGGQAACDYVIEKGFYRLVRAEMAVGGMAVHPRFRRQPVFAGTSGTTGASYRSRSYRAKEMIRAAGRVVLPGLWL